MGAEECTGAVMVVVSDDRGRLVEEGQTGQRPSVAEIAVLGAWGAKRRIKAADRPEPVSIQGEVIGGEER
jgi:hypothetical protein